MNAWWRQYVGMPDRRTFGQAQRGVGKGGKVTNPSNVDLQAPVISEHKILIDAPLAVVWDMHTDVNEWTTWQTDITEAHIDGRLEPGTSFDWTSYNFPVRSTVYEVTDSKRVLWGGTADGITGIHEWQFAEKPRGVEVTTRESFSGDPVSADRGAIQSMLDMSLSAWLSHLKAAAEGKVR
jgi:hypothetical protein